MEENKPQSFARRDRLLEIQNEAQAYWLESNSNEMNPSSNPKKYMITFPYPYMNGRLHLGHAFSMSKCEFTARYKQIQGYNVLFPQAFHCTGMPISAAANRVRNEIAKHGLDNLPTEKSAQCQILKDMGIPQDQIQKFEDPYYWLQYFPSLGKQDLKHFGVYVDFRRSFITTDYNPYYDKFIQWQFNTLKKQNKVVFGKRPSIFSIEDGQMCADHDRREGEGVDPQEYTLIKLRVLDTERLPENIRDKPVFLVAATLRPETMYGQTNCFILPTGEYQAFQMKNNEVFVCTERSVKNMAYQDLTETPGKWELLANIKGETLIGCGLSSPLTSYKKIYCYPMMTISMTKGTGIVTSVPSDSPDDFAALRDLKTKKQLREKFGLTDEQVLPFDPIPIIRIEGYGNIAAQVACDEFKVTSQNDKDKLVKAKEKVYKLGFYDGVFEVPEYNGKKVQDVKTVIRDKMIKAGEACLYWEPENMVVSRLGDECVVALCDQWYIPYGDQEWKQPVREHLLSDKFNGFNPNVQKNLMETVDWLKQWGCSRSFGLGTKLPWDPKYLIESLSDSTIYMAYYTIAHHLQADMEGHETGPMGIKSEDLNDDFFDFVFLGKENKTNIDQSKLKTLRDEFMYWYPMDLRCSGKDLIKNHLTMSLFTHQAIFQDQNMIPRGIFCNGYVQVDGEKMSKSLGNFITMEGLLQQYGADASRLALASCGDNLDDANFENSTANAAILHLSNQEVLIQELMKNLDSYREEKGDEKTQFYDSIFENKMNQLLKKIETSYEEMRFRDVCKDGFYEFQHTFNAYKINLKGERYNKKLIQQFVLNNLLILYPIAPHFCEIMYQKVYTPRQHESIRFERWPQNITVDMTVIKKVNYIELILRQVRLAVDKIRVQNQKKKIQTPSQFKNVRVIYALNHLEYQTQILAIIRECGIDSDNKVMGNWRENVKSTVDGKLLKKAMAFGQSICDEIKGRGAEVLEHETSFEEKELLMSIQDSIKKDGNAESVQIMEIGECSELQNYESLAGSVTPGKVTIQIE